jgi:hypothetical protein
MQDGEANIPRDGIVLVKEIDAKGGIDLVKD